MSKPQRPRIRRVLKWASLGVCVAHVVASPAHFLMLLPFWAFTFLTAIMWAVDGRDGADYGAKPSRVRRVARWSWLLVCPSILAAWIATAWCPVLHFGNTYFVYAGNAQVVINIFEGDPDLAAQLVKYSEPSMRQAPRMKRRRWQYSLIPALNLDYLAYRLSGTFKGRDLQALREHRILFPFWIVFLAAFTVSVLLWRRQIQRLFYRAFPPGHCQSCGYNLTGNESGICSECGTTVPSLP